MRNPFPIGNEGELTDYRVYEGSMEECDPGYEGDLGYSFFEGVQHAVKMRYTEDGCERVDQVKIFCLLIHA